MPDSKFLSRHWELVSAVLIAVVSFVTALTVYLTNNAGSTANSNNHLGMITAIKLEAFSNENWRKTYQEASSAFSYTLALEETNALKGSSDAGSRAQAANYEKYLLPNLLQLGQPFAGSSLFFKPDGSINLQARFDELQNTPEIKALRPAQYFSLAEIAYAQQRWLLVGSILLAISLFWLTVSQIAANQRMLAFSAGCFFFLVGMLWLIIYLLQTGGAA